MLNLTERQFQIIKRILTDVEQITSRHLSDIYRVSTRAIRYDLDAIEYNIKKQGLNLLRNRISGMTIEGDDQRKKALLAVIESNIVSLDFPCLVATCLLLNSTLTVTKLADELQVSRNKIIQSLDEVKKIFADAGLSLDRRSSVGIRVQGTENQIRMAKFKLNPLIGDEIESYFAKKLSHYHEDKIINAIIAYQKETAVQFSDQGSKELVLTLCYQQLRISQGYSITYDYNETKKAILSEDFEIIRLCFKNVGLTLTVEETIFVLHQIRNTQVIYLPDSEKNNIVHNDAMELTREFARLASIRLGIDFVGNTRFLSGLKLHLNVAIHRLRSGKAIKNPLTESIKYKYRFIFETCKQMITQLEHDYDLNFPDDEIAYIAMHISACFEMVSKTGYMPKALVACHSGLATSNLLATRLKVMMPELSILGPVGLSELTSDLIDEVDFIISTVTLPLIEKDVILINPLLGIDDVLTLKKRVINATSKKQLSHLIIDSPTEILAFSDLLCSNQIQLQQKVSSWRSAIEMAANPLIEDEFVSKNYMRAMIEAVEKFGPYMVFIPDIAIVHASPNAGVIKEGMSILTLKKPLVLGDIHGVSVSCFIVLAALHKGSKLFMNLVSILESRDSINRLLNASFEQEILEITNEKSHILKERELC